MSGVVDINAAAAPPGRRGGPRLGIDVGGTFTDVILDRGADGILVDKLPSTPQDPSIAVVSAMRRLRDVHGVDVESLGVFAHGSTVATNALLELKLPRTALIVTRGFRDVLEIGTQRRSQMFDLTMRKSAPIVARELVFEAAERVDRLGAVVEPLLATEIDRVVDAVEAAEVEACAVCLLFSFRNADHERTLAEALRARLPQLAIALSSDVSPEIKEFPRSSTTAISASLRPLIERYMHGIQRGMAQEAIDCPFFVMQSTGGVMSADEAAGNAHRMFLSGPAAGVIAAARIPGHPDQITFDMGGTSTDICLIHKRRPRVEREPEIDGRPLQVPQLDIHTIGSGGGSIAWVDPGGLLRVGPESAGAVPGPACYGRGGTLPTVSDAHVVLGRLDPQNFLGGALTLDLEAARTAIQTHVATPLGMFLDHAALGILDVADAQMARGIRVVSINRGFDPRDFTLVAFGGAGPMHAISSGRLVDVGNVLVPSRPGVFSAYGLVNADAKYDLVRMIDEGVELITPDQAEELYAPLLAEARIRLEGVGMTGDSGRFLRVAQMRYAWQDNHVEVLIGAEAIDAAAWTRAVARFHELHEAEFGHSDPADAVELVSIAVEASATLNTDAGTAAADDGQPTPVQMTPVPSGHRQVCFRETGWVETPVYPRAELSPGATFPGPAIVEEREATTVVIPHSLVTVDAHHNLVVTEVTA
jgi:N-methylhydantoinase A